MLRMSIDFIADAGFDDFTQIHNRHSVRNVLYDGQIVGDEEVRKRELLLQFDQKIENLALNRNIEC